MGDFMVVAIIGDWDADGVISAAEIFYSQNLLGAYPVKGRCDILLIPTSARSIDKAVEEIHGYSINYAVILDVAYSRYMDKALSVLHSRGTKVIYIDHHISTAIHIDSIRPKVESVIVGQTSTAMLVYNILKSMGIDISERLKAFVEAVTIIEKGDRRHSAKRVNKKLIDIVATLSRSLVISKNRDMWIRVVKWLTEPLPMVSLPFAANINQFVQPQLGYLKEIKVVANEIALSSIKIFNIRFIDIRGRRYPYKSTSIASALYRLLRTPIILLSKNRHGQNILVLKSSGTLAYDIALYLYKKNIAEDLMGHQTLVIMLLKPDVDKETIINSIREAIISKTHHNLDKT